MKNFALNVWNSVKSPGRIFGSISEGMLGGILGGITGEIPADMLCISPENIEGKISGEILSRVPG